MSALTSRLVWVASSCMHRMGAGCGRLYCRVAPALPPKQCTTSLITPTSADVAVRTWGMSKVR